MSQQTASKSSILTMIAFCPIIFYYISRKAEKWRIFFFFLLSFYPFYPFFLFLLLLLTHLLFYATCMTSSQSSNHHQQHHQLHRLTQYSTWTVQRGLSNHKLVYLLLWTLEITESILPVTLIESKHFKKKKRDWAVVIREMYY